MKKFFRFAAAAVAAIALFSCETPETPTPDGPDTPGNTEEPKVEYTEDIEFDLVVKEVEFDQVKVQVSHTGTKTDTWYYFATTETDIAKAVEDKVDELTAEATISGLKKTTKTTVTVRNLDPETEYNFVVFAITAEGDVYGTYNSTEFKTAKAPLEGYEVNPAWTVQYIGDYEYEGEILEHVVYVESTDNNTYFTTAWPKAIFEEYGIEVVAEEECKSWVEYLGKYGYTIEYILADESSLSQVDIDTAKYGNEWYIIAIGADTQGNPTGYYAMSELITFVEEEMTEAYADWVGNWTFTGSNGVAFDVEFAKGKSNKTYLMKGWEGPDSEGLDVEVTWMEEEGIWVIYAQSFGTYSFGASGNGEIWFVPNDGTYLYPAEGIPACLGGYDEEGNRLAIGYSEEAEDGSVIEMVYMHYIADIGGKFYMITDTQAWPTFPISITATTKASQQSVSEFKGSKKTMNNPFSYNAKTFKAYDFNQSARFTL